MTESSPRRPRAQTPGERPTPEPLRLGKYELVRTLGSGGMAAVWLARKPIYGGGMKVCALKMPMRRRDQVAMADANREALLNEIALASQLSHSNIVQCLDAGVVNDVLYIELERIDGVDLAQMMTRMRHMGRPFSVAIAVYMVREILEGLAYAHNFRRAGKEAGIVHRDINPQNVLVSSAGEVKIMDFGVGKRMADITEGLIRGKLKYMSPEQLQSITTPKLDVFAVGAIFYELVTGLEFRARGTQAELIGAALSKAPPEIETPGFPPELLEFYRCCVVRNHHDRADANEALALLKRWRGPVADAADVRVLYERQVDGGPHSGYTEAEIEVPPAHILELIEDIRAAAGAQTGEVDGVAAAESPVGQPGEPASAGVIGERVHAGSDPDAPVFMRRAGRPPSGPTVELQGPPVAAPARSSEPRRPDPRAAPAAAAPAPAPSAPPEAARPSIVNGSENAATVNLSPDARPDPVDRTAVLGADELQRMRTQAPQAQGSQAFALGTDPSQAAGSEVSSRVAMPAIDEGRSRRTWMIAAAAIVTALASVVVAWLALGPETRTPQAAAPVAAPASMPAVQREAADEQPELPSGPVLHPVAVPPAPAVSAPAVTAVPGPTLSPVAPAPPEAQPHASADPVPEIPPTTDSPPAAAPSALPDADGVAPKPTAKAPSKPKVEVRLAPFVKCEVLIGGKIRKIGSKSTDLVLPAGSQRAKWRPEGAAVWYDVATVRLEAGRRYMLTIYGPGNAKWSSSPVVKP